MVGEQDVPDQDLRVLVRVLEEASLRVPSPEAWKTAGFSLAIIPLSLMILLNITRMTIGSPLAPTPICPSSQAL